MAEKRMFAQTIIDSDAFLEMPQSSQLLYFHMGMRADDDGFVNKPKAIMSMVGSKDDDIKLLIAKKFIIPFENGIVVIKHWKIHNYIAKDRYTETKYKEQKSLLALDENKAYTLNQTALCTECIQPVYEASTQIREDKIREDYMGAKSKRFQPPTVEEVAEYCKAEGNGINAQAFIDFYESKGWMVGKNKMKSWKHAIGTWVARRQATQPPPQPAAPLKSHIEYINGEEVTIFE